MFGLFCAGVRAVCPTFSATERYHRGGDHRPGLGVRTAAQQQQHHHQHSYDPIPGIDLEPDGAQHEQQDQHQDIYDEPVRARLWTPSGHSSTTTVTDIMSSVPA